MAFNFYALIRTVIAACVSAALLTIAAQAHESHSKSLYGGVVAEAATFQAELVVKQNIATIYLSDHGKALPTKGVTGKLTVLSEGKTFSADLAPNAAGTQLLATLAAPLKSGKFAAQITLPNKAAASVRFVLP